MQTYYHFIKDFSLDLQLALVAQFSTSLDYKTCRRNGFYMLALTYLLHSLFGVSQAFITQHCTKTGLVKTTSTWPNSVRNSCLPNSVSSSCSPSYKTNQQHLKESATPSSLSLKHNVYIPLIFLLLPC